MTTTYSIDGDVNENIASITVPSGLVIDNFRVEAFNNINSRIRKLYIVPIDSTDTTDQAILKSIESKRAAGRLLMSVATIHEVENISEYAKMLLLESNNEIKSITDEVVTFSTEVERDTDDSDEAINPPILQGKVPDSYSTFGRPMSGIENDAIKGVVDSEVYNSLEDNKTL